MWGAPWYVAIGILQLICILHALKTGRRDWIYLLIFLPAVGAIIYFIREILPGLRTSNLSEDMQRSLMPGGKIKELEKMVRIADTETNKLNLAAEYARQKKYDEALELTESCLAGIYTNDPGIMQQAALYSFHSNQFGRSKGYFDKVLAIKKKFDKPEDEIVYARVLEANNELVKAEEEYLRIIRVQHSIEAKYRYGMMLKKQGRNQEARAQFQSIQDEKDLHPKYVRHLNAEWIRGARSEMSGL